MSDLIESARRKICEQAADLCNVAKLPLEGGTAVALSVASPEDVASSFEHWAEKIRAQATKGAVFDA